MLASVQSEFPLSVVICAWCRPQNRGLDRGVLGSISHGICPRHLKKMKLELQMKHDPGQPAHALPTPTRRRRAVLNHPELSY